MECRSCIFSWEVVSQLFTLVARHLYLGGRVTGFLGNVGRIYTPESKDIRPKTQKLRHENYM